VVITCRLATIKHANQILVVDNGRIVQNIHQKLIAQEGMYKRFVNIREQADGWSII